MSANPRSFAIPVPAGMDIKSFLQQFTPYQLARDGSLSPRDFRNGAVTLRSRVTSSNASSPPNDEAKFSVPDTHNLLIWGIRGHVEFNAPTSESAALSVFGNADIRDRIALKAMNARLSLQNETNSEALFMNKEMPLSSLLEVAGGKPLDFALPMIVPGNNVLAMAVSFLDQSTASIIGGSTDYGLIFEATLLRRRDG